MTRKIQVLGTGCPKCRQLTENVRQAVMEADIDAVIEKVTDLNAILNYGVMMTPALVIDGKVVATGKVPTVQALREMLTE